MTNLERRTVIAVRNAYHIDTIAAIEQVMQMNNCELWLWEILLNAIFA